MGDEKFSRFNFERACWRTQTCVLHSSLLAFSLIHGHSGRSNRFPLFEKFEAVDCHESAEPFLESASAVLFERRSKWKTGQAHGDVQPAGQLEALREHLPGGLPQSILICLGGLCHKAGQHWPNTEEGCRATKDFSLHPWYWENKPLA